MNMNPHIKKYQEVLGIENDGIRGKQTNEAILNAADQGWITIEKPKEIIVPGTLPVWPRQSQLALTDFFGEAGSVACTSGRVELPFSFPLAWAPNEKVTKVSCHEKVAPYLEKIWKDSAKHYGEKKFRELRLDQFGGCYNYRLKRTGSSLSCHAWGIAWDVDPVNNSMTDTDVNATLDGMDYVAFWKIVEAQGAISLGRSRNYDWMHFQFARLN